jgi:hypothetical protein
VNRLAPALETLGLRFFRAQSDLLLIFRGAQIDHQVLLREGESFASASCAVGRVPEPCPPDLARSLLEWNAKRSLARAAISGSDLLILADLPMQGIEPRHVEELVLSVAAAAEDLAQSFFPLLFSDSTGPVSRNLETPPATRSLEGNPPGGSERGVPPAERVAPEPAPGGSDGEIDWQAEDV